MTLTLTREEVQQVLDALEHNRANWQGKDTAIETLRARLSAHEPAPVGWRVWDRMGGISYRTKKPDLSEYVEYEPLYTAPPQREWQGLTDDEVRVAFRSVFPVGSVIFTNEVIDVARAIEAKLKEKNA